MSDGKPQPAFVSTGNQVTEPGSLMQKKAGPLATSASLHLYTFRGSLLWIAFPLTGAHRFNSARPFRGRRDAGARNRPACERMLRLKQFVAVLRPLPCSWIWLPFERVVVDATNAILGNPLEQRCRHPHGVTIPASVEAVRYS